VVTTTAELAEGQTLLKVAETQCSLHNDGSTKESLRVVSSNPVLPPPQPTSNQEAEYQEGSSSPLTSSLAFQENYECSSIDFAFDVETSEFDLSQWMDSTVASSPSFDLLLDQPLTEEFNSSPISEALLPTSSSSSPSVSESEMPVSSSSASPTSVFSLTSVPNVEPTIQSENNKVSFPSLQDVIKGQEQFKLKLNLDRLAKKPRLEGDDVSVFFSSKSRKGKHYFSLHSSSCSNFSCSFNTNCRLTTCFNTFSASSTNWQTNCHGKISSLPSCGLQTRSLQLVG